MSSVFYCVLFVDSTFGSLREEDTTDEFLRKLTADIPSSDEAIAACASISANQETERPSAASTPDCHMSDEQYAATHTLSSEIYRTHFGENLGKQTIWYLYLFECKWAFYYKHCLAKKTWDAEFICVQKFQIASKTDTV